MALNTFVLPGTGPTNCDSQGTFCFYKKAQTGVANTDVKVYVNGSLVATMSPTEHFKVDRKWDRMYFEAADATNKATFIIADSAEEYGTSQVAGAVTVTSVAPNNAAQVNTEVDATTGAGGVSLLAAKSDRRYLALQNQDLANSFVYTVDGSAPTATHGFKIGPGGIAEPLIAPTGQIKALGIGGTVKISIVEG